MTVPRGPRSFRPDIALLTLLISLAVTTAALAPRSGWSSADVANLLLVTLQVVVTLRSDRPRS
jgi:hypothetical protein